MTSFRPLALSTLSLSLVGAAAGLVWAAVAFMATGEDAQAGIGVLLGLALALPCLLLAALSGVALGLRRRRPSAATTLLAVAGCGVLLVAVQLLALFAPVR